MDLQNATYSSLPPIEAVVTHMVNNTSDQPGAMTWTGRTVDLLERLYALLRERDQLSVESVLDWAALRARLEGLPDSTSAVAFDAWMREAIENRELIKMGGGKYHYEHLATRIRAALDATVGA
ncbi:MAG: hypothetical protein ABIS07_09075 [Dokdonella sp.]